MERKIKISPELKIEYVEMILVGESSVSNAARELRVVRGSVQQWIALYKAEGPLAFNTPSRKYTSEMKLSTAKAYLNGEGSLRGISGKYGISSHHVLRKWIEI